MSKLREEVLEIIEDNGSEEEQKAFMEDVLQHGCVSGIVGPLIYYKDTHDWFDKHYDEIMELKEELEDMTGEPLRVDGDLKNFYAWLSFEEITRKIYEEKYGSF